MTAPERRPILVTGMPRSGTTWVARMLHASRLLGYLNEPFNLVRDPGTLRIPVEHWFPYITAENEDRFLPALSEALRFRYPLVRELKRCRNRAELLDTLKMWRRFSASRGRRALVKEPHAVFSANWFAHRLGSDVVVTVRHPAAVVSSWKRLGWSFEFDNLLEQPSLVCDWLNESEAEMRRALEPASDLVDRVALLWRVVYGVVADARMRVPELHVVRHEDLSREPIAEFQGLYEALGLPFTSESAAAVEASSSNENPKETRVETPYEIRIDSKANLDNWKLRLTADEIGRIRDVTEPTAGLYYTDDEWL